jgi:hypothetical protein
MIIDTRIDDKANEDRYLRNLAKEIIEKSFIVNYDQRKIGEFIKKYGKSFKGIEKLKAEHFNNYFDTKKNL